MGLCVWNIAIQFCSEMLLFSTWSPSSNHYTATCTPQQTHHPTASDNTPIHLPLWFSCTKPTHLWSSVSQCNLCFHWWWMARAQFNYVLLTGRRLTLKYWAVAYSLLYTEVHVTFMNIKNRCFRSNGVRVYVCLYIYRHIYKSRHKYESKCLMQSMLNTLQKLFSTSIFMSLYNFSIDHGDLSYHNVRIELLNI